MGIYWQLRHKLGEITFKGRELTRYPDRACLYTVDGVKTPKRCDVTLPGSVLFSGPQFVSEFCLQDVEFSDSKEASAYLTDLKGDKPKAVYLAQCILEVAVKDAKAAGQVLTDFKEEEKSVIKKLKEKEEKRLKEWHMAEVNKDEEK